MSDGASPRITPLPESEWSEEQRALLARGTPDGEPRRNNWFQTLVRAPKLYKHWAAYGSALLYRGQLSDHDREVVVLRNAALLHADMQWTEHAKIAREGGIDEPTLETIRSGEGLEALDEWDATLVSATSELHENAEISEETWGALAERLDDPQLIELIMLVGSYATMAWLQNSLKVEYGGGGDPTRASEQYHRDAQALGGRR